MDLRFRRWQAARSTSIIISLLLLVFAGARSVGAQPSSTTVRTAQCGQLSPTGTSVGDAVLFTNCANATTCTASPGPYENWCQSNGTVWGVSGGGGGGSTISGTTGFVLATGTSAPYAYSADPTSTGYLNEWRASGYPITGTPPFSVNALIAAAVAGGGGRVVIDVAARLTASLRVPPGVTVVKSGRGTINCNGFKLYLHGDLDATAGLLTNCPASFVFFGGDISVDFDGSSEAASALIDLDGATTPGVGVSAPGHDVIDYGQWKVLDWASNVCTDKNFTPTFVRKDTGAVTLGTQCTTLDGTYVRGLLTDDTTGAGGSTKLQGNEWVYQDDNSNDLWDPGERLMFDRRGPGVNTLAEGTPLTPYVHTASPAGNNHTLCTDSLTIPQFVWISTNGSCAVPNGPFIRTAYTLIADNAQLPVGKLIPVVTSDHFCTNLKQLPTYIRKTADGECSKLGTSTAVLNDSAAGAATPNNSPTGFLPTANIPIQTGDGWACFDANGDGNCDEDEDLYLTISQVNGTGTQPINHTNCTDLAGTFVRRDSDDSCATLDANAPLVSGGPYPILVTGTAGATGTIRLIRNADRLCADGHLPGAVSGVRKDRDTVTGVTFRDCGTVDFDAPGNPDTVLLGTGAGTIPIIDADAWAYYDANNNSTFDAGERVIYVGAIQVQKWVEADSTWAFADTGNGLYDDGEPVVIHDSVLGATATFGNTRLTQASVQLWDTVVPNDGVDDAPGLKAGIVATAGSGITLYFPAGTYDLSSTGLASPIDLTLMGGVNWRGELGRSILRRINPTAQNLVILRGPSEATVDGLTFDWNGLDHDTAQGGIQLLFRDPTGPSGPFFITRNTFLNSGPFDSPRQPRGTISLVAGAMQSGRISDVWILDNYDFGAGQMGCGKGPQKCMVQRNHLKNVAENAVTVSSEQTRWSFEADISYNDFDNITDTAVYVGADFPIYTAIPGHDIRVIGNTIRGPWTERLWHASTAIIVKPYAGMRNVLVADNIMSVPIDLPKTTNEQGILLNMQVANTAPQVNVMIHHNICDNLGGLCTRISGNGVGTLSTVLVDHLIATNGQGLQCDWANGVALDHLWFQDVTLGIELNRCTGVKLDSSYVKLAALSSRGALKVTNVADGFGVGVTAKNNTLTGNYYGIEEITTGTPSAWDTRYEGNDVRGNTLGAYGTLNSLSVVSHNQGALRPAQALPASGGQITANACDDIKQLTSTVDLTTDPTDTLSVPAADNAGCSMTLLNTNAVGGKTITLDPNTTSGHFRTLGGAPVVLQPRDSVVVTSTGGAWYQISSVVRNQGVTLFPTVAASGVTATAGFGTVLHDTSTGVLIDKDGAGTITSLTVRPFACLLPSEKQYGITAAGTVLCAADQDSGSPGSTPTYVGLTLSGTAGVATLTTTAANPGTALALTTTPPTATTTTTAGAGLSLTASNATVGTTTNSAAAGGSVTLTAGNADRFGAVNNGNGGNVVLTPGLAVGAGQPGQILSGRDGTASAPAYGFLSTINTGIYLPSNNSLRFSVLGIDALRLGNSVVTFPLNTLGIGNGATTVTLGSTGSSPLTQTLRSADVSGAADRNASDMVIATGTSTGTGSGAVIFTLPAPGTSGSGANTTTERARIMGLGALRLVEAGTDPLAADLTSGANIEDRLAVYMKNDKVCFAFNRAGVVQYLCAPLDATTGTVAWTNGTTAP